LPKGEAAIPFTLAIMKATAENLATTPELNRLAWFPPLAKADTGEYLFELWRRVRRSYRFRRDPSGVEFLRPHVLQVRAMLEGLVGLGDCDDLAVITGAVLELCRQHGHVHNWQLWAVSAATGGNLAHVFAAAEIRPGVWFAVDPQEGTAPGQIPPCRRLFMERNAIIDHRLHKENAKLHYRQLRKRWPVSMWERWVLEGR